MAGTTVPWNKEGVVWDGGGVLAIRDTLVARPLVVRWAAFVGGGYGMKVVIKSGKISHKCCIFTFLFMFKLYVCVNVKSTCTKPVLYAIVVLCYTLLLCTCASLFSTGEMYYTQRYNKCSVTVV